MYPNWEITGRKKRSSESKYKSNKDLSANVELSSNEQC